MEKPTSLRTMRETQCGLTTDRARAPLPLRTTLAHFRHGMVCPAPPRCAVLLCDMFRDCGCPTFPDQCGFLDI